MKREPVKKTIALRRPTSHGMLPNDACPTCGTMMKHRLGTLRRTINGEPVRVPRSPHLLCPKCGEAVLTYDEAIFVHGQALAIYRSRYGLLSGDEIRAIRLRHRLTQAQLARLLRLGANTLSRWEADRFVQTAAMDLLLRMVRDVPGSLPYLRKQAP